MGIELKATDSPPATSLIQKGPMEGMLLVDGQPQMECMDMPSISFESILALQRFNETHMEP